MKKTFSFFMIILWSSMVQAETYQVGPSRPYTNLQTVAPLLQPGDVVLVDGNATYPGDVVFTESGTPDEKITIQGVRISGNRPVITGGTNTVHFETPWPYSGPGADHYIFEGFDITGGSSRGIYHQANDLIIRDVVVHDCPAHGILGADEGSGSLVMEHVEVHHCGSGDSRHQIYMATDEVNHPGSVFRMQYCYIHDGNGGNNVKSRAERNEIYFNWIEGAYYHELELIGPDGAPPELKREDSDVVGNVFWKRNTFYVTRVGGDGTGETDGRYRFVNNTFICGDSAAFRLYDGIESIEMHNNVFYRSGTAPITIVRTIDAEWSTGEERIAGTNNWIKTGASAVPVQWTGTVTGTNPGFVNFSGNDLRLITTSPLINAGTDEPAEQIDFLIESPLFPPTMHPPLHSIVSNLNGLLRPVNHRIDIGAYEYGQIRFVDWRNTSGTINGSYLYPYRTIQEAVNASGSGHSIFVAQGHYSQNIVINGKSLALFGAYIGGTESEYASGKGGNFAARHVISTPSHIYANTDSPAVRFMVTGSDNSWIDGFHISGGRHGIDLDTEETWPELSGIIISNNVIETNGIPGDVSLRGGGMRITGEDHRIIGNTIRYNAAGRGGGIAVMADDVLIQGNVINSNEGYDDHAGGIYQSGTAEIIGNTIRGNRIGENLGYGWGGGILILGMAFLSGNTIADNFAVSIGGGVFVDETGQAELRNNLIYGNTTSAHDKGGAAIYIDGGAGTSSHATIINCTIADNTSPGSTGGNGIYIEGDSSAAVENCIFWNNSGDDYYVQPGSHLSVVYTLSQEPVSGIGNIIANPLFANPSMQDYHLKSMGGRWNPVLEQWVHDTVTSPAIDAGNPDSDYSAEPEPNGARSNLGVYGNTSEASRSGGVAVPAFSTTGILILLTFLSSIIIHRSR